MESLKISTNKGAFRSIRGDTQSDWPDKETRSRHKRQGGVAGFDNFGGVVEREFEAVKLGGFENCVPFSRSMTIPSSHSLPTLFPLSFSL
jgi:hypothetical protein